MWSMFRVSGEYYKEREKAPAIPELEKMAHMAGRDGASARQRRGRHRQAAPRPIGTIELELSRARFTRFVHLGQTWQQGSRAKTWASEAARGAVPPPSCGLPPRIFCSNKKQGGCRWRFPSCQKYPCTPSTTRVRRDFGS